MAAIVEVKDVHKSYGKNEVLKGISLDVARRRSGCYDWTIWFRKVNFLAFA